MIRRLAVIGINTAPEWDIYGNVNSTHVNGTHMMNGIGDFACNAYLAVFVTRSLAANGMLLRVVPMVTHVDRNEHDADVIATGIGLADLRGLASRERFGMIIRNCVHPSYREMAYDYFKRATQRSGHNLHLLDEAFSWHIRTQQTGSMPPNPEAH